MGAGRWVYSKNEAACPEAAGSRRRLRMRIRWEQVDGYTAKARQLLVQQPVHVGSCKTPGAIVVGRMLTVKARCCTVSAHEASKALRHAEQPEPPVNHPCMLT